MSAVYFLSDLHLGHKNICKFRTGFNSVEEHNALIKENYHKRVTKRDTVYFLGDVAFDEDHLLMQEALSLKLQILQKDILQNTQTVAL